MIAATSYESALFAYVFDNSIIERENIQFKNSFLVRLYKNDEGITRDYDGPDSYTDLVMKKKINIKP